MKKIIVRLSLFSAILFLLYGATRLRGIRFAFVEAGISYCIYPLLQMQKAFVSPLKHYRQMTEIHREMEATYRQCLVERENLLQENIALSSALDVARATDEIKEFKKRYSSSLGLTVQVIGRHFNGRHFFWIDAGKNRGITVDMVVVHKNCLIGRVSEVYPYYSKVTLITDPLCKVAAFCKNSQDHAIHEGTGSLKQTKLSYVFDSQLDLEKRLKKGDLVLSSGEGLIFPKGFGLGTIESFRADDLYCDVVITPLINFETLDYCCIIAKGSEYYQEVPALSDHDMAAVKPIQEKKIFKEVLKSSVPTEKKKNAEVTALPIPEPAVLANTHEVIESSSERDEPLKSVENEPVYPFSPLKISDDE